MLNPARSSAFFMYTVFFLESKSSWRNLGFTIKNVIENKCIVCLDREFPSHTHVFDDIFDSKSKMNFTKIVISQKVIQRYTFCEVDGNDRQ